MSAPKSVVKIDKNGVHYESNVDACNYYLFELSRAALRDVGRFIAKKFKQGLKANFKSKRFTKGAAKYTVFSSKNTKYPRLQIGLKGGGGSKAMWWSWLQEFGTHDGSIPKLSLFKKAAQDNIAEIIKIESQYLSGLSEEADRLAAMVDEAQLDGSDED